MPPFAFTRKGHKNETKPDIPEKGFSPLYSWTLEKELLEKYGRSDGL